MGRFDRYRAVTNDEAGKPSWPMALGWAMGFFTTLPAGPPQMRNPHARDVFAFLVVGVLLGTIWGAIGGLMLMIPNLEVATLVVTALLLGVDIVITGGMHADGLADVADGFAAKRSGADVKRAMEDAALGAVGGAYLITFMIIRFALMAAALYTLAPFGGAVFMVGLAPLVARGLAGMALRCVAPAEGGLSDPLRSVISVEGATLMLAITAAMGSAVAYLVHVPILLALAIMAVPTVVALFLINRLSRALNGIGGGDICGTGLMTAEALVCLGLALSSPYLY